MTSYEPSPTFPADQPEKPPRGDLPPIQPPTMGFVLQLFVIPMVIVTIIVLIWLLFNWLAHMGNNPVELVNDLKKLNDSSWQKALTLADLLRNPRYEHIKRDPALARELSDVLNTQIDDASMDENLIQLRMFLCRALGEFKTPEGLPVLLRAAQTEREPPEAEVRLSALQSLAVFVSNNRDVALQQNEQLLKTLLQASQEQSTGADNKHTRGELRSHAAFALGMLGGDAALTRLDVMLGDAYPNARYNAATGLSRYGDLRALPVLREMLDPENSEAVRTEDKDEAKPLKRLAVMQNGLRAAMQLAEKNESDDLTPLVEALDRIIQSDLKQFAPDSRRGIRISAEEVQIIVKDRGK